MTIEEPSLVYLDQFGLEGSNYYWQNRKRLGYSEEELIAVDMPDNRVRIHPCIVRPLLAARADFQADNFELFIKEGYRSQALYQLVYERKVAKDGKIAADKLFNMEGMPHASGMSVDITLRQDGQEIYFRKAEDGLPAMFVDFYQLADDEQGRLYQQRQAYMIQIMQRHGFRLGTKREYWHFDYDPDSEINYP